MRSPAVILVVLFATLSQASAKEPAAPFRAAVVGEGPSIIFIPGLNSSGAVWDGLVNGLRDRYTCHVLTLAGFAGEPAIGLPFLPAIREGVRQYIRDRGLQRPVIVGHSLGGVLALWLAATADSEVGPIVTIDGVPFLPALMNAAATAESVTPMAIGMRDVFIHASEVERARQTALSLQALVTDPAHVRVATQWAAASDPITSGHALMEVMTTDLRPEISRIRGPVLLIAPDAPAGAAPERIRLAYQQQFAPIPDHRIVFVPNARHFVMLDDPAAVLSAINAYLN